MYNIWPYQQLGVLKSKDFGTGGTANTGGNWPHSGKATPLNTGHLTPADRHGSVQVRYFIVMMENELFMLCPCCRIGIFRSIAHVVEDWLFVIFNYRKKKLKRILGKPLLIFQFLVVLLGFSEIISCN